MAYRRHTPRFEDVVLIGAAAVALGACAIVWAAPRPAGRLASSSNRPWGGSTPMVVMIGGVSLGVLSVVIRAIRGDRR